VNCTAVSHVTVRVVVTSEVDPFPVMEAVWRRPDAAKAGVTELIVTTGTAHAAPRMMVRRVGGRWPPASKARQASVKSPRIHPAQPSIPACGASNLRTPAEPTVGYTKVSTAFHRGCDSLCGAGLAGANALPVVDAEPYSPRPTHHPARFGRVALSTGLCVDEA
jgi:hypothetical protein